MSTQSASQTLLPRSDEARLAEQAALVRRLRRGNAIASSFLWLITMVVAVAFVAIILNIIWTGLP
ncbi:MAG TPA: hypothetical protein VKX46_18355, partial [Ktedonobacteraceae bacterium]|nr:hypothetical protein [Ktedonobacteraceae bacterium]